ncbi:Uncharacterized protein TCM_035751 [Theobroma cacao]|uniref:Uncharacterized protein n=1 Tax=Theobroma cacao TaxID=3641 RepID=A0A061FIE9_THECC|nr:Uncharacterized protein TCM_035751 [Theobroma cacao]
MRFRVHRGTHGYRSRGVTHLVLILGWDREPSVLGGSKILDRVVKSFALVILVGDDIVDGASLLQKLVTGAVNLGILGGTVRWHINHQILLVVPLSQLHLLRQLLSHLAGRLVDREVEVRVLPLKADHLGPDIKVLLVEAKRGCLL